MSLRKQNDAVFEATVSVLAERGFKFEAGMNASEVCTKDDRQAIVGIVTQGILNKTVALKAEYGSEDEVRNYVSGMVNNHFRKDLRLNGGTPYQPKNPGSRVGSQDEVIKNLRALKSQTTDENARTEIEAGIQARIAELKAARPAKAKAAVKIDATKLPENFRKFLPQ